MQILNSMFPVRASYSSVRKLSTMLDKLQVQLATQKRSTCLSELGSDRMFDLTVRARLSRLDVFNTTIDTVNLRLDYLNNSISRLDEIESDVRSDLSVSGAGSDEINIATASEVSYNRLDEILAILNGDLNGRYMFAGNETGSRPVVSADVLLNGSGTRAGLKQILEERKLADFGGTTGLGRLDVDQIRLSAAAGASNEVIISESSTANGPLIDNVTTSSAAVTITPSAGPPATSSVEFTGLPSDGDTITVTVQQPDGSTKDYTFTAVSGTPTNPGEFEIGADADATAANFLSSFSDVVHDNTVTVAEDGDHPFGVKLDGITTASSNISVLSQTTTQPHVLQISVDNQPEKGETLTIAYTLPDGSTGSFEVEATTEDPPARGQFLIGADTDETAANISDAITGQLEYLRETDLSAASANKAVEDFITTGGNAPQRVDGPPFDTATAMVDGTEANTVIWYTGESASAGTARQAASAQVDENTTVYYGVLGNEQGLADLVRATAVMAAESFSSKDDEDADRYQALAQRQVQRLAESNNGQSGSIEAIALELGLSKATVGSASNRHTAYAAQLETMLADIESVDVEEVAMKILAAKTMLEASYQTMARLSQLSLVNFMS
jgi:flagellar hook-associated protein 3 FlgL